MSCFKRSQLTIFSSNNKEIIEPNIYGIFTCGPIHLCTVFPLILHHIPDISTNVTAVLHCGNSFREQIGQGQGASQWSWDNDAGLTGAGTDAITHLVMVSETSDNAGLCSSLSMSPF